MVFYLVRLPALLDLEEELLEERMLPPEECTGADERVAVPAERTVEVEERIGCDVLTAEREMVIPRVEVAVVRVGVAVVRVAVAVRVVVAVVVRGAVVVVVVRVAIAARVAVAFALVAVAAVREGGATLLLTRERVAGWRKFTLLKVFWRVVVAAVVTRVFAVGRGVTVPLAREAVRVSIRRCVCNAPALLTLAAALREAKERSG